MPIYAAQALGRYGKYGDNGSEHRGTRVVSGSVVGLNCTGFWLICNDNPLAVYELSGKLSPVNIINLRPGQLK
jgi:hypothetical protein